MIADLHFPNKATILAFLEKHPSMQDPWFKVNGKVVKAAAECFQNQNKAPLGVRMALNLAMADLKVIPPGEQAQMLCEALIDCAKGNQVKDIASIREQISEVDLLTQEVIGTKICETVLNRLGPKGKFNVELAVNQKKGTMQDPGMQMMMMMTMMAAEHKKEFMDVLTFGQFVNVLLYPIKDAIKIAFQNPARFCSDGLSFTLSDYGPMDILAEAAEKIKFQITLNDVPVRYQIQLNFDQKRSQEQSTLVVSIKEFSEKFEISEQPLVVKNLLEEFRVQIKKASKH